MQNDRLLHAPAKRWKKIVDFFCRRLLVNDLLNLLTKTHRQSTVAPKPQNPMRIVQLFLMKGNEFKVVVVGDAQSGKSCICKAQNGSSFSEKYKESTSGKDY